MTFQKITHVIFDMDGLLLDSERLYTIGFQNIVGTYGKVYSWDLKVQLMGKQAREAAEMTINALDLPITVDQFLEEKQTKLDILFENVALMPGAQRLIDHLHNNDIPFAMATSSSRESADLKMKNHGDFFAKFSHRIFGTSDPEVKRGKPEPDIFLYCASKFPDNPQPKDCLVFEDAPNGVRAGIAAGMQVVMVPDEQLDRELTTEATLVIPTLEHFKPELFGLPPFKD